MSSHLSTIEMLLGIIVADNQNDIKEKVDKIYDLLIRRKI